MAASQAGGFIDYKIHCFHGEPKVILVYQDRYAEMGLIEDFYSEKWEHLNVSSPNHPNANCQLPMLLLLMNMI